MYQNGSLHIPVSIFTFPFKAIGRLVGFSLRSVGALSTLAFLLTGVGSIVALATGGFRKKYKVLDFERKDQLGGSVGRLKVEERPGWVGRAMGRRVRQTEYVGKNPTKVNTAYSYYKTDSQESIAPRKRDKIRRALEAYEVMNTFA